MARRVFITGGTGYMGSRLIPQLVERSHEVRALVRRGSETKLPKGVASVLGDPLTMNAYADRIPPSDTFVHLIGVSHPSPAKAAEFRSIDLVSVQVAVPAARAAGIKHFVYLSVAHPSPMMKDYIAVRMQCERMIRDSGMNATFVRPWYVLGPGHRWPCLLLPFYWICERLPNTRESAKRLGLVTIDQMLGTLVWAVENPAQGVTVLDVPRIRELGQAAVN